MTRVPMFTPNALPAKAGLGTYTSPGMQQRYPGVEFSQFTGAEMIAKKYGHRKGRARPLRAGEPPARHRRDRARACFEDEILPLRGRGWPTARPRASCTPIDEGIRFDATLEGIAGREADRRGRALHRRHRQPDLRRRQRRAGGQRARPEGAGREAAGAHPPHERAGPRPGDHAGGADSRHRSAHCRRPA